MKVPCMQLHSNSERPGRVQSRLAGQWALGLSASCLLLSGLSAGGAQPAALPHVDQVASSQSMFIDDPNFGKDPFFPKSDRRKPQTPVQPLPNQAPDNLGTLNGVVLKGISGLPGKRLALLNNRTVEAGEVTEFRHNNQTVRVRCVEIREKSVILGVEGSTETKEIHLRTGM